MSGPFHPFARRSDEYGEECRVDIADHKEQGGFGCQPLFLHSNVFAVGLIKPENVRAHPSPALSTGVLGCVYDSSPSTNAG